MTCRLEGTFVIDGLLEGKLPGEPDVRQQLRLWAQHAARNHLEFNLEFDADRFSLLARNHPLPARVLGCCPAERVAGLLGDLLKALPAGGRQEVFSTLRTTEYRPGQEVQTVFGVGTGGAVEIVERVIPAETTKAPPRRPGRRALGAALLLLTAVAALAALAAPFVDYPKLWQRMVDRAVPLNVAELQVDSGSLGRYVSVVPVATSWQGAALRLRIERQQAFPLDAADYDRLLAEATSLEARLAVEAVARGYVRCELLSRDGKFLGESLLRVSQLRTDPSAEVAVPLPDIGRVSRLVLVP